MITTERYTLRVGKESRVFQVTRFSPHQLRIGIIPTKTVNGVTFEGKPIAPKEVGAAFSGHGAALNGPWGGWSPDDKVRIYRKATSMVLECGYFDKFNNIHIPPTKYGLKKHIGKTLTIGVRNGLVYACRGKWDCEGADVAVQLPMTYIVDSKATTPPDARKLPWPAFGVNKHGQLLFIASPSCFIRDLQDVLLKHDVTDAGGTDGGGSTAMLVADQCFGSTENRKTPSHILVLADSNDPVITYK